MPLVGVVMGSQSDEAIVREASSVLDDMGVDHEVVVMSAHRTPEKVMEYTQSARERGIEVLIAAAGGSAGLPGVMASWTTLPVIGIPIPSSDLKGLSGRPNPGHQARGDPRGLRRVPPRSEEPVRRPS